MTSSDIIVSVIVPCFNDGKFLPEAIQSVEESGSVNHEVIIVDDGSDDPSTLNVFTDLEKRGYRIIHQKNTGLGGARNRGITAAQGRYILPLDSDNRIRGAYLDRGIEILDRETSIDVVYGDAEYFGERHGRHRVPEFSLSRLLAWNYIDACAIFRKSAWERCRGYDESMPCQGFEDWDLWCRIACSGGNFFHVAEVLYDYRIRKGSMSSKMTTETRVSAILSHMRAKKIEISMGSYLDAYQSWEFLVQKFRHRPLRTLAGLFLRSYFPSWHSNPQSSPDATQRSQAPGTPQ